MEDMLQRIKANEITLTNHDRRLTNLERINDQLLTLSNQNTELIGELKHLKTSLDGVATKVDVIDKKFHEHEMEPAGNWKKLGWTILMLIVGAVMALVLKQIGLGG